MKSVVKVFVMMIFSFGLIYTEQVNAQELQDNKTDTTIGLYHLELSDNKTTNLIFPYAVKSVDRGSADVIAQVVQGFGNVLQLKANVAGFKQTNITVITSDGKFYSFLADYNTNPKSLNLSFVGSDSENTAHLKSFALPDDYYNEAILNADAVSILSAKSFLSRHTINEQMKLRLEGIYLKAGLMWFKLSIHNQSQVGFDVDNISFSVVDKKQVKRTARQEILLQPTFTKSVEVIQGNTTKELVFGFKPFTLTSAKRLKIQISEKSGGRKLILLVKAKKLLRARLQKT
ncbi:MAG: conjugative transposon protein TraN [Chitinophagaceae bacterium]|nr:MAG: conjugative transposon protein TraN [Chitinophagaceae bacterium]